MIIILLSTPTHNNLLFIISMHYSYIVCHFKCMSSLKQDWLANSHWLSLFLSFLSWKKKLKMILTVMFLCAVVVVVWIVNVVVMHLKFLAEAEAKQNYWAKGWIQNTFFSHFFLMYFSLFFFFFILSYHCIH